MRGRLVWAADRLAKPTTARIVAANTAITARCEDRARRIMGSCIGVLQPVLEQIGVDPVAAPAAATGPDVALVEPDEVERLLGEPVAAVGARLRIRECGVDALDPADLPLEVARRAVVARMRPRRDANALALRVPH